jgi:hypothetical protein
VAQKLPNGIHCGTIFANTGMAKRWSRPKTMGGNPNIQRAALAALARNGESVETLGA